MRRPTSRKPSPRTLARTVENRRRYFVGEIEHADDAAVKFAEAIRYLRAAMDDAADEVLTSVAAELVGIADARGVQR